MSESITGYIDHIIFRNEDNGYTCVESDCKRDPGSEPCVGGIDLSSVGWMGELLELSWFLCGTCHIWTAV